jgi:predicted phosphodiesterase
MKGMFWEDGILRISFVTDEHFPVQSNDCIEWRFEQIEQFKPHIVWFGGDVYDGEAWSRWDQKNWSQYEEYVKTAEYFQRYNDMDFIKKKVWMYGNHEHNRTQPGRVKKSQLELLDWESFAPPGKLALRDVVQDWRIIKDYGSDVYRSIGPIAFTHGTRLGLKAAEGEADYFAPHMGLCLSGHTHKPVPVTRAMRSGGVPADYWFANAGTAMCPKLADYMGRANRQGWGCGIVNIEVHSRDATLYSEGRKVFRTKIWEAETKIRGIYRDVIHGRVT